MGFERGWGQILGFFIDLRRRPYNTCECVMVLYCVISEIQRDTGRNP